MKEFTEAGNDMVWDEYTDSALGIVLLYIFNGALTVGAILDSAKLGPDVRLREMTSAIDNMSKADGVVVTLDKVEKFLLMIFQLSSILLTNKFDSFRFLFLIAKQKELIL